MRAGATMCVCVYARASRVNNQNSHGARAHMHTPLPLPRDKVRVRFNYPKNLMIKESKTQPWLNFTSTLSSLKISFPPHSSSYILSPPPSPTSPPRIRLLNNSNVCRKIHKGEIPSPENGTTQLLPMMQKMEGDTSSILYSLRAVAASWVLLYHSLAQTSSPDFPSL